MSNMTAAIAAPPNPSPMKIHPKTLVTTSPGWNSLVDCQERHGITAMPSRKATELATSRSILSPIPSAAVDFQIEF